MSNSPIKPLLVLCFLCCGGAFLYAMLPYAIKSIIQHQLSQHIVDISELNLPEPNIGVDYITYNDISLDKDNINTIGSFTITFTPEGLLTGRYKKVIIEQAEIIASVDRDGNITLDGWLQNSGISKIFFLAPELISLRASDITLLTPQYGGITVDINASANLKLDPYGLPQYEFQGQFDTQQRHLSLRGNVSGGFNFNSITAQLEFERGKVSIPEYDLSMTRLSGSGQFSYENSNVTFTSELRSGGLKLNALPWKNTSMTYNLENKQAQIYLSAQSIGIDGLELGISRSADEISTTIHTPSAARWDEYIELNNIVDEKLDSLVLLLDRLKTKIELE